jgi:hypothetical protein
MGTDVTTRSYDFARTGANTAETVLTPAAVKARGVKTLLTLAVPDDPRLEAQPLYLSNVNALGATRNVIYQATMANAVHAWDADTGQLLWTTKLGTPISSASAINAKGENVIDTHKINIDWGILSTPVIDRAAGVLYACAWISPDGSGNWQTGQHVVAALDVGTGALRHPLLSLQGTTYDPGHGLPVQQFRSMERKQRAALALAGGAVIVCFGTIVETGTAARGWVVAVDTARWALGAAWCSTVRGSGGGIWMSGAGPAIQGDGSIWVVTGNGDFDGQVDFGESVVRLRYAPAPAGAGPGATGSLAVTGWWTPWTDDGRTGGKPEGEGRSPTVRAMLKDLPRASNFRRLQYIARAGLQVMDSDWGDQDLGASGIVLLEDLGVGLVSSKDGILYTISLGTPGDTAPADLSPAAAPANYARLAAPPILYTYYDPAMNPATPNPAALNQFPGNATHHLHGTPVVWQSAARGRMHFCGGENGNLRAWSIGANNRLSTYLGCSAAYASAACLDSPAPNGPKGGMPGWSIALSANGAQDGVVWGMIPYGDANLETTNGRLLAYDAANLAAFADGSGEIVPLWDSQDWNWSFYHPKFNRPVAVAGKVIVPTYDGRLLVLGLA